MAIVVVLPSLALLWLVVNTVENERLAVRQKLIDVYQQRLDKLAQLNDTVLGDLTTIEKAASQEQPGAAFAQLVSVPPLIGRGDDVHYDPPDAVVIYDGNGEILYPPKQNPSQYHQELPDLFDRAWELEFRAGDFAGAGEAYARIAANADHQYTRCRGLMGQVRSLRKAAQTVEAIRLCRHLAYEQHLRFLDPQSLDLIASARVLLIELHQQAATGQHQSTWHELLQCAIDYDAADNDTFLPLSSKTRIFVLRKVVELAPQMTPSSAQARDIATAKTLLAAEELSAIAAEHYPTVASLGRWPRGALLRTALPGKLHGVVYDTKGRDTEDRTVLALHRDSNMHFLFQTYDSTVGSDVDYRITDNRGDHAVGLEDPQEPFFVQGIISNYCPGWSIELYFRDNVLFERTAGKRAAVYLWAALLVIALMLAAGALAARAIGKQIKVNRLKNDFIATVSHELKTPLASMRVLVDTILEGRTTDDQQVREYLELVGKENHRLSRLIDNFLTFSRMERNKQSFDIIPTNPAHIAHDAIEAVKTKFAKTRCQLEQKIESSLPAVLADHDAMVTVLVNLLDNACKYGRNQGTQVCLTALHQGSMVCFEVKDNGIGMSRRACRKVFNRFYQVDQTLSRQAEGCGLGLSIVKFIVDAHHGSISVQSQPGKGSTFTVKIPKAT